MGRLRRHRLLVVGAFILACVVGILIPFQVPSFASRQQRVGIATESALVDSTKSQVADLGSSSGSDIGDLAYRASLLASLMTTSPIKEEIAKRAGIAPGDLIATGPATAVGTASPAPSVPSASVTASSPNASTLSATVPTLAAGQIPVIQVNTQAPTVTIAAALANAAFTTLEANIDSIAAQDNIPDLQRVVVRSLGPAQATSQTTGLGLIDGIVAAIVVFLLACGAIVGLSVRASKRTESDWAHGPADPDDEDWTDVFNESPIADELAHGESGGAGLDDDGELRDVYADEALVDESESESESDAADGADGDGGEHRAEDGGIDDQIRRVVTGFGQG